LLAVRILGVADRALRDKMVAYQEELEAMVLKKDAALRDRLLGNGGSE
jgi:5-(carboxyamino)imidazole ribonucleotide mutase